MTSLFFYMICFSISILFSKIYQGYYIKKDFIEPKIYKKFIWFILIIAIPVLISGFRDNVGTDYNHYLTIYYNINLWPFEIAWKIYGNEPLFFLLNKISYTVFNSEWGIFLISSFIIHFFIIWGIDFFKKDISIPFALFLYFLIFFNFGLNVMRQTIAISIVFFAIRYIYKRKLIPYIIMIFLASLFHNTAIICLIFYFLTMKKNDLISLSKNLIYYLSIILTPIILLFIINLIDQSSFFGYSHYIADKDFIFRYGFLLDILPVIIPIFIFKKSILNKNKSYESIINLSLLTIPFQYIGYYAPWGSRLVLYAQSLYLILVPLLIYSIKNKENKILLSLYYFLYFLFIYIVKYYIGNSSGGFPYKSIFL